MTRELPVHALGFAAVAGAALAAAALLPLDAPPLSLFACPFRFATGWPCLTCGCVHAFHFAVRGRLDLALAANPLGALLALAAGVHLLATALRLCGAPLRLPALPPLPAPLLRAGVALGVLLNWGYVAWRFRA